MLTLFETLATKLDACHGRITTLDEAGPTPEERAAQVGRRMKRCGEVLRGVSWAFLLTPALASRVDIEALRLAGVHAVIPVPERNDLLVVQMDPDWSEEGGAHYARVRALYFRRSGNTITVVGKSTKANQGRVISILKDING